MTSLAQYEHARLALAEATTVNDVLSIHDEVEHIRLYAKQIRDRELMIEAAKFQVRVERKLGLVMEAAREAGQIAEGRPKKRGENTPFPPVTLAEVGVDKNLAKRARRAASISEQALEAMIAGIHARMASGKAMLVDPLGAAEKDSRDATRRADHAARTVDGGTVDDLHALAASGFRAGAILADPPWKFLTRSAAGEGRSANLHYKTEFADEIKAMPVADLAAKDCVLFMWMVDWCPQDALDLIAAWGFEHKTTAFTWAKQTKSGEGWHMGQGYWTRSNPEACWLATRGNPKCLYHDVRQLIVHPVMEHSRKPAEIHDRIERLVAGPYLELYARREVEGWRTWGNELAFELPPHDPITGEIIETEGEAA